MASLVYALVSAVLLVIVKELNLKYMNKIRMPIPMEIIIVSAASAVPPGDSFYPHLSAHFCSQRAQHIEHLPSEEDTGLGARN